jgi:hypothetical protein
VGRIPQALYKYLSAVAFTNVCICQRGVVSDNNLSLLTEGGIFGSCIPITLVKWGYLLHICLFEQTGHVSTSRARMKLSDTAVNHIHNFWCHANLVVWLLQSTQIEYAFRITLMSRHFRAYWELYGLVQVDKLAFILQPISRWGWWWVSAQLPRAMGFQNQQ